MRIQRFCTYNKTRTNIIDTNDTSNISNGKKKDEKIYESDAAEKDIVLLLVINGHISVAN